MQNAAGLFYSHGSHPSQTPSNLNLPESSYSIVSFCWWFVWLFSRISTLFSVRSEGWAQRQWPAATPARRHVICVRHVWGVRDMLPFHERIVILVYQCRAWSPEYRYRLAASSVSNTHGRDVAPITRGNSTFCCTLL